MQELHSGNTPSFTLTIRRDPPRLIGQLQHHHCRNSEVIVLKRIQLISYLIVLSGPLNLGAAVV